MQLLPKKQAPTANQLAHLVRLQQQLVVRHSRNTRPQLLRSPVVDGVAEAEVEALPDVGQLAEARDLLHRAAIAVQHHLWRAGGRRLGQAGKEVQEVAVAFDAVDTDRPLELSSHSNLQEQQQRHRDDMRESLMAGMLMQAGAEQLAGNSRFANTCPGKCRPCWARLCGHTCLRSSVPNSYRS